MSRRVITRQPQCAAPLAPQYESYISAANNWAVPSPGWVGVSSPTFQATDDGLSVAGNASSSYATRPIPSTLTQPMWMMVYFVAPAPSSSSLTYYAISAETGSTPQAMALLRNGDGTNTNLSFLFRGTNGGSFNHKNGPVLTAGQLCCAVCMVPTGSTASTYMYVNGIKYNTAAASDGDVIMGGASFVNETVDALKRSSVTGISTYKILLTAHGIGSDKLLSESQARDLSINPWLIYAKRPGSKFAFSAGGASAYYQSVAGALSFAGTLPRSTGKQAAGALSFASGTLARAVGKLASGALSFAGTIASIRTKIVALGGSLSFAGGLSKSAGKGMAGTLALSGTAIKSIARNIAGALSFAGALASVRTKIVAIAGGLSFSGAMTKRTGKQASGALTFSGAITRSIGKGVSGALSFAGGLGRMTKKSISGVLSFIGALVTVYTAAVSIAVFVRDYFSSPIARRVELASPIAQRIVLSSKIIRE